MYRLFLRPGFFAFFTALFAVGTLPARANFAVDPVSEKAYVLFEVFGLPVTNSMVTTWVITLILIVAVRLMVGRSPKLVPSHAQAVLESAIESLRALVAPIVGNRVAPAAFPLLFSLFIYILIMNWSSLLPGVGTVGYYDAHGHLTYFLRPASSDLNTTLALAAVALIGWLYFTFRYAGARAFLHELFGNKADKKTTALPMYLILGLIFLAVGGIEVISYLFRLVSLSFRLYGNVYGGEALLSSMFGLPNTIPVLPQVLSWLFALPFYFLEMLIGLVQALVFMLLTAVYIGVNCNHGDAHKEGEGPHS